MKIICASIFAITLGISMTSSADTDLPIIPFNIPIGSAHAAMPEVPEQITESESLGQYVSELLAVQSAELVWLDAQAKYFEIMRASFVGSRAMSNAFQAKAKTAAEANAKSTAVNVGVGGVTLVVDAYLAKAWLAGATPTVMMVKDIIYAARGNTSRMTAIGQKTWASIVAVGKSLKVPKNFVTTAAIGTFAYVQVENYFVINMSEAQYNATIADLDAKIATLVTRKAAVADLHVPYSAR